MLLEYLPSNSEDWAGLSHWHRLPDFLTEGIIVIGLSEVLYRKGTVGVRGQIIVQDPHVQESQTVCLIGSVPRGAYRTSGHVPACWRCAHTSSHTKKGSWPGTSTCHPLHIPIWLSVSPPAERPHLPRSAQPAPCRAPSNTEKLTHSSSRQSSGCFSLWPWRR